MKWANLPSVADVQVISLLQEFQHLRFLQKKKRSSVHVSQQNALKGQTFLSVHFCNILICLQYKHTHTHTHTHASDTHKKLFFSFPSQAWFIARCYLRTYGKNAYCRVPIKGLRQTAHCSLLIKSQRKENTMESAN